MRITNIDKNISSCFMTAALVFIAVEPVIHDDWLSYTNTAIIMSLLILSFIQKDDIGKPTKNSILPELKDDIKDSVYKITICIAGMIIAWSEGSKMLYAWMLLFLIYFFNILLTKRNQS